MSKRLIVLAGLMVNLLVMMRPPLAAGQDAGGHPVLDPGFIPRLLPPMMAGQDAGQRLAQPNFALRVWVNKDFNDGTDAGKETVTLHERVKEFLNKAQLGVPDNRVQFFESQWENNPPIIGWNGMVQKVAPIKGGYAVTLKVSPIDLHGGYDSLRLYEHYTIVGGKVNYRGFTLPPPGPRFRSN